MRNFQVTIKVNDMRRIPDESHTYTVYTDANDFYAAVGEATKSLFNLYQDQNDKPFGRTTISLDGEILSDI